VAGMLACVVTCNVVDESDAAVRLQGGWRPEKRQFSEPLEGTSCEARTLASAEHDRLVKLHFRPISTSNGA
jgi:hypothetical protein